MTTWEVKKISVREIDKALEKGGKLIIGGSDHFHTRNPNAVIKLKVVKDRQDE